MKSSSSKKFCSLQALLLFTIFFRTSFSYEISYSHHCSSIIPEATPTIIEHNAYPVLRPGISYYSGGERILGKNSSKTLSFHTTQNVYQTNVIGVYKFAAYLSFRSSNLYYIPRNSSFGISNYSVWFSKHGRNRPGGGSLRFLLSGYWSESLEKICMVGSASWLSSEGKILNLGAVLKLHYARNSSISNSLVSGILENLGSPDDSTYFEPISILGFARMNEYKYSLVSGEFSGACSGGVDVPLNSSLGLQPRGICSMLSWQYSAFRLEYGTSNCSSLNNCTSFGPLMYLYTIQCSEQEQKLRYLVKFPNTSYSDYREPFNPNTSLVGEGSWDAKKNRLCIVACRLASSGDAMGNSQLGDCSIRLSLRYPSVWSIKNSASIEGQIWTNKTPSDSGYFDGIKFQSTDNSRMGSSSLKYEYTEIERARSSCPVEKKRVKKKGERYPDGHSSDMSFDMKVENSKGKSTWGYAVPMFIGDKIYDDNKNFVISSSEEDYVAVDSVAVASEPALENINYINPLNISYRISFSRMHGVYPGGGLSILGLHSSPDGSVEISAEGVYDAETGKLCLVGCRDLGSFLPSNDSLDCEILLSFQFPPVNGKSGNPIKGTIKSMRKEKDPLYFEHLSMYSTSIYTIQAKQSIWRMDLEITMVLISNTLACVFVGLQLFHVKKQPQVLPLVSILMVLILTLGHMIPLLLNFEAMFLGNRNKQNVMLGSGGWLEVNEVIVRVVTMVAFLLQFRLLQQAWTARFGDENRKGLWVAEKKALLVSLLLYILGGLVGLFVSWNKYKFSSTLLRSSLLSSSHQRYSFWGDIRSYTGLVLDGFLFPQIILNLFTVSTENGVLSHSFYIGTTFVRLLPHGYDLYRVHNYVPRHFNGSYIYANPTADFYSKAWDVIIPCGGILFAVIIFLQQRFGGRFFLPRRFREVEVYEKVPVVGSG
ncbi:hypothetical protein LguiA_023120 [Lonicera macranthoides]